MPNTLSSTITRATDWLRGLSFTTGLWVAAACGIFYIISFAQMALPLPVYTKGILWTIFFGLAKAAQYTAILILGKEGISRLKSALRKRR